MFKKVTEHVYIKDFDPSTDKPNIGYIKGEKYSLLFEAGNSPAHADEIRRELADAGLKEPDLLAVSHWHWDHTFAMCAWQVPVIAGRATNEELIKQMNMEWTDEALARRVEDGTEILFCASMLKKEYGDLGRVQVVPADIVFDDALRVDLGGVSCSFHTIVNPHSADSVVCYVPEDRFLFLGDSDSKDLYGKPWTYDPEHPECLVPAMDAIPFDEDKLSAYISAVKAYDFDLCIDGHIPMMTRSELLGSLQ